MDKIRGGRQARHVPLVDSPMSDSRCSMVRFMVKEIGWDEMRCVGQKQLARWLNCQVCSMRDKFNSLAPTHTLPLAGSSNRLQAFGRSFYSAFIGGIGCCIRQVRVCRLIALEIACDETYGLCKKDVAVTRRYLPG